MFADKHNQVPTVIALAPVTVHDKSTTTLIVLMILMLNKLSLNILRGDGRRTMEAESKSKHEDCTVKHDSATEKPFERTQVRDQSKQLVHPVDSFTPPVPHILRNLKHWLCPRLTGLSLSVVPLTRKCPTRFPGALVTRYPLDH